ncbi:MAG: OsmC family protein [Polyangiales bacterium]
MSQAQAKIDTKLVNGIDTEALGAAVAGITADPTQGQVAFRARTSWQGGLRSRTEIAGYTLAGQQVARRHTIHADEPREILGGDSAPNPQELLLASLAACMTVGFVAGAIAEGIHIDSLTIDTECALDLRGAFGLDPSVKPGAEKIRYAVRVTGSGTPEQFAAIHERVTQVSPNYYHLSQPIPFESSLTVG